MVSPSNQQTRIYQWMSQHLPRDGSVCLNDVTSMYTVINVVGPKSAQLMGELSNSNINLSPFTYKKVNVGYASDVMVMSFTHTGEPGYCLFVPSEYALHVYDRLMTVSWWCICWRRIILTLNPARPTGWTWFRCPTRWYDDTTFYAYREVYTVLGRRD